MKTSQRLIEPMNRPFLEDWQGEHFWHSPLTLVNFSRFKMEQASRIALLHKVHRNDRLSDKLRSCATSLVFEYDPEANDNLEMYLMRSGNFCDKTILCPLCASRRAYRLVMSYMSRADAVMTSHQHLRPYMLTLTVKSGADLQERFSHLKNSFTRYLARRQNGLKGGRAKSCELTKAVAGAYAYEVTHTQGIGWHPHLHMVLLVDPALPIVFPQNNDRAARQSVLAKEWLDVTGDSFIVDCRPIAYHGGDTKALQKGLAEVFKYALKASQLDPVNTMEVSRVFARKQLCGCFGSFRGLAHMGKDYMESKWTRYDQEQSWQMFYRYFPKGYQLIHTCRLLRPFPDSLPSAA